MELRKRSPRSEPRQCRTSRARRNNLTHCVPNCQNEFGATGSICWICRVGGTQSTHGATARDAQNPQSELARHGTVMPERCQSTCAYTNLHMTSGIGVARTCALEEVPPKPIVATFADTRGHGHDRGKAARATTCAKPTSETRSFPIIFAEHFAHHRICMFRSLRGGSEEQLSDD